jgi:UDP-GlcNAc:undecaprenyl-phosphate GlcNAc-1-phosphate transferase
MNLFIFTYFFIALLLSLAINYLLLKFSFNLGSRNNIAFNQVRWTSHVKPSVGGISFFIIFLLSWGIYGLISPDKSSIPDKQIIGIVISCSLGFFAGLYDDTFNTNPLLKFVLQLTCGLILLFCDIKINISNIELLNVFFTLVWVVGMMNSINMLDNMDGVTATISAFIISGLMAVLIITGHPPTSFYMMILSGVLGALFGFLRFNWSPSRIFMGDTGSQFLGVLLAAVSILFLWSFNDGNQGVFQVKPFVLPALFFIVPLIDTATVTLRRILRGQSPFVGGKDHITHHFAYLGLKENKIVLILLATSLVSFPVILLLITRPALWNFYISFGILAYVILVFFVFQFFYKQGELMHQKKIQEQRPIPKISKEPIAGFAEQKQA